MKKLISVLLLLTLVLGLFAGCGKDKQAASDLEHAVAYLTNMYQTAGKDEAIIITADLDVLSSVVIDGVSYGVEWTVAVTQGAADSVTVAESKQDNHVKLDIPLHSGEDILFTATATVSDAEGNSLDAVFNYMVEGVVLAGAGMTMEELVEAAYNLDEGEALEGLGVLTGVVTVINTPWDDGYKNLTVSMVVGDLNDMPIKCYRLKGDGAETIAVGDTITVSGTLKNYNGTIEFDAGCMLDELIKGEAPAVEAPTDPMQIVQDAYALEDNASLTYTATLTGTITVVDTPYDAGYQNVTVTIVVDGCEDMPIKCYRLKGTGADTIGVGDKITVTGILMNYNGTVEFAQGCTLDAILTGGNAVPAPSDPLQIVDEAYALAQDTALPYNATLTGVITVVDTPYDTTYQNITVTMTVAGREAKPIKCFRMKGTGVDTLAVGDTITVTGIIKNYMGTVEFDAGCTMTAVTKGPNSSTPVEVETDPLKIIDAAYTLAENAELPYNCSLTGKVTEIVDAYDPNFKNITVTIKVAGREAKPIVCYRLSGSDVSKLAVNDTITVVGKLKNYYGKVQLVNGFLTGRTSGGGPTVTVETNPVKIVDAAYGLSKDTQMAYDVTLTGKVSSVKTAYDPDSQNVSVVIQVTGRESKPILCYRMKGTGADLVAAGDTITVAGRLKNYNGTVEFAAGCTLISRTSGGGTAIKPEKDPAKIMAAAGKLGENEELPYKVTLSGKVTGVNEAYDKDYQNITVTINVNGANKPLKLFRLKGDGVAQLAAGDTITVEGTIKNYNGEIELVNGTMTARTSGGGTAIKPETDPARIMAAAEALAEDTELPYKVTLSGKVTMVNSPYDPDYQNITFTITVDGTSGKSLYCFRVKGDNAAKIVANDQVTIEGKIKNYGGKIELVSGNLTSWKSGGGTVQTAPSDPKQIVDAAYALAPGAVLPYKATLTGKITSIDTEWSEQHSNITVTIVVAGKEDKPIKCFRLKGDGAKTLAVGNTITVNGVIKNYQHSSGECEVEFDAGCMLQSVIRSGSLFGLVSSEIPVNGAPVEPRAAETNAEKILNDAYALQEGESLSYVSTLTGKIIKIKDPYNASFKNISVIIEVPGFADKPMLCYRVAGTGADKLLVDDTITVTGTITNYVDKNGNSVIEFKQGCTLDKVISGGGSAPVAPEDPKQIVEEAFELAEGESLPYKATLTGVITEVGEYNETYGDITVKMTVEGKEFECYALKGENVQDLAVGDTITVTGTIKNYYGKVEVEQTNMDAVVKGGSGDDTEPKMEYYLFGYINGADYACNDDWENLGEYKLVDGKLTTTFTADSYVAVKTGDNTGWYMTKAYVDYDAAADCTTGTFINTSDASAPAEKMKVPGNQEVTFTLTENADGTLTLSYTVSTGTEPDVPGDEDDAPTTVEEIIDAAYALEDGESLDGTYTLTGMITSVDTLWSDQFKNITVTIKVAGSEDQPIKCYRLAGTGADKLLVDDTITVTGTLTNYKGSIQFAQGCTLDKVISGGGTAPVAPEDPKQIVKEAFELAEGQTLPYKATLTGVITEVGTYNETYGDITVKMMVECKEFECYALKGEGVGDLAVGDTITVTGIIKNYYGKVEFDKANMDKVVKGDGTVDDGTTDEEGGTTTDKTPAEIVDEAYALEPGASLPYTPTLTGKITEIVEAYSEQYKNITLKIVIEGKEDKPIVCYRLKGEGVDALKVGDTITVTGTMINYVKKDSDTGEVISTIIELSPCTLVTETTGGDNTGDNNNSGNNNNNTGNNTGNNNNNTGNNNSNSNENAPTTGDFMLTGLFVTMALAGTGLLILKKKEF